MFRQFNCYIIPVLLLLFVSIFSSVSGVTCSYYQIHCYSYDYAYDWCCPSYQYCGDYFGTRCTSYSTDSPIPSPPSNNSPTIGIVFAVIGLICCKACIIFWCRAQRTRQQQQRVIRPVTPYNGVPRPITPYQQQPVRNTGIRQNPPARHIRPAPSVHHVYEEAPPSYEIATKTMLPQTPSAPPYEATSTDQAHFRV